VRQELEFVQVAQESWQFVQALRPTSK